MTPEMNFPNDRDHKQKQKSSTVRERMLDTNTESLTQMNEETYDLLATGHYYMISMTSFCSSQKTNGLLNHCQYFEFSEFTRRFNENHSRKVIKITTFQ